MSINSLSLAHPSDVEETWQPQTPLGPPPTDIHRVRAPRRCSLCRGLGHDRRACVTVVPTENTQVLQQRVRTRAPLRCCNCERSGHSVRNCPNTSHQLLCNIILSFLEFSYPDDSWRRPTPFLAIFHTFMNSLTPAQIEEAILSPNIVYRQVARILHQTNARAHAATARGKDYAKKISLVFDVSCEEKAEKVECFICCEESCSLKASCGHEFCGTCVNNIIVAVKDKTSPPVCSYCRAPFTCLTTPEPSVYATISDFIKNL